MNTKPILYSQQYDGDYLEAAHLTGDTKLVISEILPRASRKAKTDGKPIDKPILKFKGAHRGMVLNKTNAKVLANAFGPDMARWTGQTITLYPTTCKAFGVADTPCIRVKTDVKARIVPVDPFAGAGAAADTEADYNESQEVPQ